MTTLVFNGTRTKPFTAIGANGKQVYVIPGLATEVTDEDAEILLARDPGLYIKVQPDPQESEWLPALADEHPEPKRKSKGN